MKKEKEYIGILDADYDEPDGDTFRGLVLTFGDHILNFETGDPIVDWYNYKKFVYTGEASKRGIFTVRHLSSCDHWFMDTETYREHYLKVIDEDTLDFMTSEEIDKLTFKEMDEVMKCVAHKDMKTFQEVKDYCKQKNDKKL